MRRTLFPPPASERRFVRPAKQNEESAIFIRP